MKTAEQLRQDRINIILNAKITSETKFLKWLNTFKKQHDFTIVQLSQLMKAPLSRVSKVLKGTYKCPFHYIEALFENDKWEGKTETERIAIISLLKDIWSNSVIPWYVFYTQYTRPQELKNWINIKEQIK